MITQHLYGTSHETIKISETEANTRLAGDPSLAKHKLININDPSILEKDPKIWGIILNAEEIKEDRTAAPEYLKEYVVASKASPLQRSLNAIAKANAAIDGINLRTVRKTKTGPITMAKSVLTDESSYGDFWNKYRSILLAHLQDIIESMVANGSNRDEMVDKFTPRSQNNPEKFASTERLQNIFYSSLRILRPDTVDQDIAEFEAHIKEMKTAMAVNTLTTDTLTRILLTDGQGNTSMRMPLLRKSPTTASTKVGINDLGSDLSNPENRKELEGVLNSNFQEVTPHNLDIKFKGKQQTTSTVKKKKKQPKTVPQEQVLPRVISKPQGKEADKFAPDPQTEIGVEAVLNQVIASTKSTHLRELARTILKNTNLSRIGAYQIQSDPDTALTGGKKFLGVTYSQDALSAPASGLKDVIMVFPRKDSGTLLLDSTSEDIFLHELIHALTISAIDNVRANKGSTKEQKLVQQLTALQEHYEAGLAKKKIPISEGYQSTSSKLDIKEFVANLSSPKFIANASKIRIKQSNVLRDILQAILEFLGVKSTSVYNATLKMFEEFIKEEIKLNAQTTEQSLIELDDEDLTDMFSDEISFATGPSTQQEDIVANNGAGMTVEQKSKAVSKMIKFNVFGKTADFILDLFHNHYLNPTTKKAAKIIKLGQTIHAMDENPEMKLLYRNTAVKGLIDYLWNTSISFEEKRRIRTVFAKIKNDAGVLKYSMDKIRGMLSDSYVEYNYYNVRLLKDLFTGIDEFVFMVSNNKAAKNISKVLHNFNSSTKRTQGQLADVKSLQFIYTNFASSKTYNTARLILMDALKSRMAQNESANNSQVVRSREEIVQQTQADLLQRYTIVRRNAAKNPNSVDINTELSALNSILSKDSKGVSVFYKMIGVIYPK